MPCGPGNGGGGDVSFALPSHVTLYITGELGFQRWFLRHLAGSRSASVARCSTRPLVRRESIGRRTPRPFAGVSAAGGIRPVRQHGFTVANLPMLSLSSILSCSFTGVLFCGAVAGGP
jgi:hypothetical protein